MRCAMKWLSLCGVLAFWGCGETADSILEPVGNSSSSQTQGLSSSSVGAVDSLADESVEVTYNADSSMAGLEGYIEAAEGGLLQDIQYSLVDAQGQAITGAMLAYSLKQAAQNVGIDMESEHIDGFLLGVADITNRVPGVELSIDLASIDSSRCGELTLTLSILYDEIGLTGGSTGETIVTDKDFTLYKPCGRSNAVDDDVAIPDFGTVDNTTLITRVDSIGGAKASLASSFDLDAGKKYSTNELTGTIINDVDLVFNGTKIMTPWGTSEVGYMSKTYAASTSEAMIIPVAATANPQTTADLIDLIDVSKAVYMVNVAVGGKYIVVTSVGVPVFVSVSTIDSEQVMTFKFAK